MSRHLAGVALTVCVALLVGACSHTLTGTPVSVFSDPFRVAGMPATDGPSGLRSDAAAPARKVTNTDNGDIDRLAASAISDIEEFWRGAYSEVFGGAFTPVNELISWDANGFDGYFCGSDTYGLVNAAFCHPEETIGWDRGELMPAQREAFGEMAVAMVLAHEYGHAIQNQAGLTDMRTQTLVAEQQADCMSGAFMRWVAEGNSSRFTLNTSDGLNHLLAAVIAFRDPLLNESDADVGFNEHGSAFERVSAFQFGFTDAVDWCARIDMMEIGQRRGDLPVLLPDDQDGELSVTEESVRAILGAVQTVYPLTNPPTLSFDTPLAEKCPDARSSPPVSYCPASNTVVVDMEGLQEMGGQPHLDDPNSLAVGDNTAYSMLVSRHMLAFQRERGLVLDSAETALRTACLTGSATTKMSKTVTMPDGQTVGLTAGDIDEAVSGILTNGLAASDVNGESVPSGFARIDAFRLGVLGNAERCLKRFP